MDASEKKPTARDVLPPAPVPPAPDAGMPKAASSTRTLPRLAEQVPPSILQALSPTEIQRQEILYELMETERQYVKDLESLARDYVRPLRRMNLLTGQQLDEIFSNIDQVIDCNSELLAEFEKQKKVSSLLLGDVGKSFHARSTLFKVYSIYCANHPLASATLEELRAKNVNFDHAIKELSTAPSVRYTSLENMLILPVQRLYKYPLFLENLLHYTPPSHRDYDSIQTALTDIREIADLVDARVTEVHRVKKLKAVQASLHPRYANAVEIIVPGRKLLGEFTLKQNAFWGKSRLLTGKAIFFNDALLLAEKRSKGLRVQRWLSHDEYSLKESATQVNTVDVTYAGGATDAWQCESESERKALIALYQQLAPAPSPTTAPMEKRPVSKRSEGNGSRSISLRNVRLLLNDKDSLSSSSSSATTQAPATLPINANAGASSGSTVSASSSSSGSSLAPRASLRVEAENAELAAMRLKLLEWRNLVDAQGSELANERKMRVALEQKVLSLMEELNQERRARQALEKLARSHGIEVRPPSPPSKPLPATPPEGTAPASPMVPPLPSFSSLSSSSSSSSISSPSISSSTSTSTLSTADTTATSNGTPAAPVAAPVAAPSPASRPLMSPRGGRARTHPPAAAAAAGPSAAASSGSEGAAVSSPHGSNAATTASAPLSGGKSPGRPRHTINISARNAAPAVLGRISFFENVSKSHEEKQIILSPRGERDKAADGAGAPRSRSAKRMDLLIRPTGGRTLTRTLSAGEPSSAVSKRDAVQHK